MRVLYDSVWTEGRLPIRKGCGRVWEIHTGSLSEQMNERMNWILEDMFSWCGEKMWMWM